MFVVYRNINIISLCVVARGGGPRGVDARSGVGCRGGGDGVGSESLDFRLGL